MAVLEEYFYHETITKYTSVFGTIFNNLKIKHGTKTIKVPLTFIDKAKSNSRSSNNADSEKIKIKTTLPRMAFRLSGWEKDDSRIINNNNKMYSSNKVAAQNARVPYNFTYELSVKTKHMQDMLQIVEQILPTFNPDVTVVVKDNPDLDMQSGIVISLVSSEGNFEMIGEFTDTDIIEANFTFSLEGWLYQATTGSSIINKIILNYHDLTNMELFETDIIE